MHIYSFENSARDSNKTVTLSHISRFGGDFMEFVVMAIVVGLFGTCCSVAALAFGEDDTSLNKAQEKAIESSENIVDSVAFEIPSYGNIHVGFDIERLKKTLRLISDNNPDLYLLMVRCEKQLDDIAVDKDALSEISKSGLGNIEDFRTTLNTIEQEICQNLHDIINFCIAVGSNKGEATYEKLDQASVNEELESNDLKLKKVDELLNNLVIYVNQHDNELSNLDIDTWNKVLKTINEQSELPTT